MANQLWGPFQPLPNCRLWLSEDHVDSSAITPDIYQDLAEAHLSEQDLERWRRYRPQEKKRQFLNSRLAIRTVLQREFGTASDSYKVETIETGQPILKLACQHKSPSISISHTGDITAVVLSDNHPRLGVDIETVQSLNLSTLRLAFMNQMEHDWLRRESLADSREMTLAVWTLKEALWKALGGPRDLAMSEIEVEYQEEALVCQRWSNKNEKQSAVTAFFGHELTFPCTVANYSSFDRQCRQMPSFVGCIVLIDQARCS